MEISVTSQNQGDMEVDDADIDKFRRTILTSIRYNISNASILRNYPRELGKIRKEELKKKFKVDPKSLYFYFILLLNVYPP